MSQLLGADTRRVDGIAERLHGYSQDVQNLATLAHRAVIELRNAWGGTDFERLDQGWEHEAGPRLADAASSLSAMALALRTQVAEQRRVSGDAGGTGGAGGSGVPVARGVPPGTGVPVGAGGAPGHAAPGGGVTSVRFDQGRTNGFDADASLVSVTGGDDSLSYELAAGRVEAKADSSVDVDGHGNLRASAGASAAAYLGYAAGRAQAGNDLARVGAESRAYAGAEVGADASGSIGLGGAAGHVGAEAFAGAKADVIVDGTVAGVTAAAGAEISYGIGAHAEADVEVSSTNVGVALDVGATLGLGVGAKFDVSINPQEVVAAIDHAFDALRDAADRLTREQPRGSS